MYCCYADCEDDVCPGDIDGDGHADQADLGYLLACWGCTQNDPCWTSPNPCAAANVAINDPPPQAIDQSDLGVLLGDWDCSGSPWCPGDVDGDGDTDHTDQGLVLGSFCSHEGDPNWNPRADLDGDGHVGAGDLAIVEWNLGCET